ncbi:MAG: hypothetical protein KatS3mg002_0410 [Candidatus Woesearchaeota archaeon]|nr:MAG: hypothetical protein KatS3mg002_0410 [Candidatus Woesearchaeota archaeon]
MLSMTQLFLLERKLFKLFIELLKIGLPQEIKIKDNIIESESVLWLLKTGVNVENNQLKLVKGYPIVIHWDLKIDKQWHGEVLKDLPIYYWIREDKDIEEQFDYLTEQTGWLIHSYDEVELD